jgi:methionine-rich copper-binding protein CopC
MSRKSVFVPLLLAPVVVLALLVLGTSQASAHARYDYSDPPAGGMVEAGPFVLMAWFTQELMKASTISVVDAAGVQVDIGDGRVDLDDPDRMVMLVSVPEVPAGVYTVNWVSVSAEDGDEESGTFTIGVGVMPPAADVQPSPIESGQ